MKEKLTKIIYTIAAPALAVALLFAVYRTVIAPPPSPEPPPIERADAGEEPKNPSLPGVEVANPQIKHFVDGAVKWTVGADSISSDMDTGLTKFMDSRGTFIREEGFELNFIAPLTVYDRDGKTVKVEGGVSGTLAPEGHALTARDMEWAEKTDELVAREAVVRISGGSIRGDAMRIDREGKRVAMDGNVVIELEMERGGE